MYLKKELAEREVGNVKMAARLINAESYFTRMKAHNRKISRLKRNIKMEKDERDEKDEKRIAAVGIDLGNSYSSVAFF